MEKIKALPLFAASSGVLAVGTVVVTAFALLGNKPPSMPRPLTLPEFETSTSLRAEEKLFEGCRVQSARFGLDGVATQIRGDCLGHTFSEQGVKWSGPHASVCEASRTAAYIYVSNCNVDGRPADLYSIPRTRNHLANR